MQEERNWKAIASIISTTIRNDYYWAQATDPELSLGETFGGSSKWVTRTVALSNQRALTNATYQALCLHEGPDRDIGMDELLLDNARGPDMVLTSSKTAFTREELQELLKPWPEGMREVQRMALAHDPSKWSMSQEETDEEAVQEAIAKVSELF